MTVGRVMDVKTRFVLRAQRGRGVGLHEAVEAAEARLEAMGEEARGQIDATVGSMQAARPALVAGDPAAFADVRARADLLTGVAPIFGAPEVAGVAASLLRLYEACDPARPSADAVGVHLDALRVMHAADPETLAQAAPALLQGLEEMTAARSRPE